MGILKDTDVDGILTARDPVASDEAVTKGFIDKKIVKTVNQQAETIHLKDTNAGTIDELKISSEPSQYISPNLYSGKFKSQTINGVALTQNSNGSFMLNGTATARIVIALPETPFSFPAGTIMTMGKLVPDRRVDIEYYSTYDDGTYTYFPRTDGIAFTLLKKLVKTSITLIIEIGMVFSYVTVYPMLNLGSVLLPFQSYTGDPSPDNAIPITVASSPIEIMSARKNLLSKQGFSTPFSDKTFWTDIHSSYTPLTDGWIKFYFDNTQGASLKYCNFWTTVESIPLLKTDSKYTFVLETRNYIGNNTPVNLNISQSNSGDLSSSFLYAEAKDIAVQTRQNVILTTRSYIKNCVNCLRTFLVVPAGEIRGIELRIMILAGEHPDYNGGYIPNNEIATILPLKTTSGKIVELLGEYNTKTNILEQKWGKIVFNGTENWKIGGNGVPRDVAWFFMQGGIHPAFKTQFCNKLKYYSYLEEEVYWALEEGLIGDNPDATNPDYDFNILIKKSRLSTPDVAGFKAFLASNNFTIYYQLDTPEILTMEPTPPIPTLAGETNIYAVNNASPISFDITELSVGGPRKNVVLKDANDRKLMLYTTSNQVEIDSETGKTLDREIVDIDKEISIENAVMKKADLDIEQGFQNGDLTAFNGLNATMFNTSDKITLGSIYENLRTLAFSFNRFDYIKSIQGTAATGSYTIPMYANGIFLCGAINGPNGLMLSRDGKEWEYINRAGYWNAPIYANGIFVASSTNGQGFIWSGEGSYWTSYNSIVGSWTQPMYTDYNNGIFVCGSTDGHGFAYSTDGFVWNYGTGITTGNWSTPMYANGIFISPKHEKEGGFVYSTDGKYWLKGGLDNYWNTPMYANGIFVSGSGNYAGFAWSLDGKSWTKGTGITGISWNTPIYANGIFVSGSMASIDGVAFAWSIDGKEWNVGTGVTAGRWETPIYANGIFVSSSPSPIDGVAFAWSIDGKEWNVGTGTTTGNWNNPIYANGIFVSASQNEGGGFVYSTNGKLWLKNIGAVPNGYESVMYGNGIFVFNGTGGFSYALPTTDYGLDKLLEFD